RFDIARTHDLANLSPLGAGSLRHQRATFRVAPDSSEDLHNGYTIYDCESVDGKLRTVWLVPGVEVDDGVPVDGRGPGEVKTTGVRCFGGLPGRSLSGAGPCEDVTRCRVTLLGPRVAGLVPFRSP